MYDGLLDDAADAGQCACDVPLSSRIEALESRVRKELPSVELQVRQSDLYAVGAQDRGAVIDALVTAEGFPIALLEGKLICTGGLDADAIVAALSERVG
jgi:hypothetical protein